MGSHSLLQGNLPDPGIKPRSPALQADSLPPELQEKPKAELVLNVTFRPGLSPRLSSSVESVVTRGKLDPDCVCDAVSDRARLPWEPPDTSLS